MSGWSTRITGGVVAIITSAAALFAAPPSVVTKPLTCIAKNRNARITARIEGPVKSARVYFHSTDPKCDEYYVDMRPNPSDPTLYWALLPLAAPNTRALSYQVRVDPGNGAKVVVSPSEPLTVPVIEGCIADPLSPSEQRAADNITLGLTSGSQRGAPCAFQCKGVTSMLTSTNELRPNEDCFNLLAANKAWYTTGAGKQAIGAGAALLGGALIWNHRHDDDANRPVSPARP